MCDQIYSFKRHAVRRYWVRLYTEGRPSKTKGSLIEPARQKLTDGLIIRCERIRIFKYPFTVQSETLPAGLRLVHKLSSRQTNPLEIRFKETGNRKNVTRHATRRIFSKSHKNTQAE